MKQWLRGGANNTPHHASGTRATDRALSHTRSLTAAAIAVAMMATVAVTSLLPPTMPKLMKVTMTAQSARLPAFPPAPIQVAELWIPESPHMLAVICM